MKKNDGFGSDFGLFPLSPHSLSGPLFFFFCSLFFPPPPLLYLTTPSPAFIRSVSEWKLRQFPDWMGRNLIAFLSASWVPASPLTIWIPGCCSASFHLHRCRAPSLPDVRRLLLLLRNLTKFWTILIVVFQSINRFPPPQIKSSHCIHHLSDPANSD